MFTTGAAGATILALAAKLLPLLIGAIASAIATHQAQEQAHADTENLGAARTTAAINRETADANRRAAEAAINAPPVGSMLDAMSRGEF